jgi:hypothetical protein
MSRYALIEVPGAFVVVDASIPGGRDVERHGERERAEAVLARLQAEEAGARAPAAEGGGLAVDLGQTAGEVIAAVKALEDAAALKTLEDAEKAGAGRKTVLEAIGKRLEGLGVA